ncbi:MAG: 4Fe-4S binding protein [Acetobacterium woodii]|nr:4Fe-4S binding protein [Acetobacterium woodii]
MIFYFTGTGNSLYAAKKIGDELGESLIDITAAMKEKSFSYTLSDDEKIGFVFPVYFYGVPSIVVDFIAELKIEQNLEAVLKPYVFGVVTCGGGMGGTPKMLEALLEKQGLPLSASFELKMASNYIMMYQPTGPDLQKKIQISTDKKLVDIITGISKNKKDDESKRKKSFLTSVAYPLYRHGRKTRLFYADEKCNGCGKCARVCPVTAITMEANKPVWTKKQCTHCTACINRCPQEAIQYGKKTLKWRRFENPILK